MWNTNNAIQNIKETRHKIYPVVQLATKASYVHVVEEATKA